MIIIVRHPDPFYGDEAFTFNDTIVKELTPKGIERAEKFAQFVKTLKVDWNWAICSPKKRVVELFNIVKLVLGFTLETESAPEIGGTAVYQPDSLNKMYSEHMIQAGISELSCYSNIWEQMEAFQPVCVSHDYFHQGEVVEDWQTVSKRVLPFLEKLLSREGNGLVFTHFEILWVILQNFGFDVNPAKIIFCDHITIEKVDEHCVITWQGQTKVILE